MAKNIKQSLDNSLAHIRLSERQHQQILQEIVEEGKMKRKVLGSVITIALIILLSIGAVYALFHSQIAEVFQRNYGSDRLQELEQGKLAQVDESFHVNGVDFHFGEAILKDGNLFLAVDISTKEEVYLNHSGLGIEKEQSPLLISELTFEAIGVDKDDLLEIGNYSSTLEKVDDKHWKMVYEFSPSFHLPESESIFVKVGFSVRSNSTKTNSFYPEDMVVLEIRPTVEVPKLTESSPAPLKVEEKKGEGEEKETYEIVGLELYEKMQSLPIFKAIPNDFRKSLIPELFNQSKITERTRDSIAFADEAHLHFTAEDIYYLDEDGTFDYAQNDEGTSFYRGSKPSIAAQLVTLVSFETSRMQREGLYHEDLNKDPLALLENKQLTHIGLQEARNIAEKLILAHELREYELTFAYDMHRERIQRLAKEIFKAKEEGKYTTNWPMEFLEASEEDEGYYLEYKRQDMDSVSTRDYALRFYITKHGIVHAEMRESHKKGVVLRQSGKLLESQEAVEALQALLAARGSDLDALNILGVRLCYQTKLEGKELVYAPIWQVLYTDEPAQGFTGWANFDAVDGKLLGADFR